MYPYNNYALRNPLINFYRHLVNQYNPYYSQTRIDPQRNESTDEPEITLIRVVKPPPGMVLFAPPIITNYRGRDLIPIPTDNGIILRGQGADLYDKIIKDAVALKCKVTIEVDC